LSFCEAQRTNQIRQAHKIFIFEERGGCHQAIDGILLFQLELPDSGKLGNTNSCSSKLNHEAVSYKREHLSIPPKIHSGEVIWVSASESARKSKSETEFRKQEQPEKSGYQSLKNVPKNLKSYSQH